MSGADPFVAFSWVLLVAYLVLWSLATVKRFSGLKWSGWWAIPALTPWAALIWAVWRREHLWVWIALGVVIAVQSPIALLPSKYCDDKAVAC